MRLVDIISLAAVVLVIGLLISAARSGPLRWTESAYIQPDDLPAAMVLDQRDEPLPSVLGAEVAMATTAPAAGR